LTKIKIEKLTRAKKLFDYDSSASLYVTANSEGTNVGAVDLTLKDERRNRNLPVRVYYPQEEGSFPVIIFSHGVGGSRESFSYLSRFWSSYGYVCIHPTHLGSDLSVLQRVGLQALLETTNDPEIWSERPQDISFIIDSLEKLEQAVPQLQGKINHSFIGVSGHSFGAYTTLLLAGAVIAMPGDETVSFRDERAWVFLGISPPGTGRQGLHLGSWDRVNVPVMTVSGSEDMGLEGKPASWRMEAFKSMPPIDKYHVLVKGANHFSFDPDMKGVRTPSRRMNRPNSPVKTRNLLELENNRLLKISLQNASMAFWDAYLKFQKPPKEYLMSDNLQTYSDGDVAIFVK
jgi:predicted dienelactone hydrolase